MLFERCLDKALVRREDTSSSSSGIQEEIAYGVEVRTLGGGFMTLGGWGLEGILREY